MNSLPIIKAINTGHFRVSPDYIIFFFIANFKKQPWSDDLKT